MQLEERKYLEIGENLFAICYIPVRWQNLLANFQYPDGFTYFSGDCRNSYAEN